MPNDNTTTPPQNTLNDGFWGVFRKSINIPRIRWDPFRTIINDQGLIVGHRVHFSTLRAHRPHEFNDKSSITQTNVSNGLQDDTFCKLIKGDLPSIVLSKDNDLRKDPFSTDPSYEDLSHSTAFSLINMYTPMTRVILSKNDIQSPNENSVTGIPLVHILTKHYQKLEDVPIDELTTYLRNITLTVNETIKTLCSATSPPHNVFHFCNIGAEAGASIPHLHSQTLIFTDHKGLGWKDYSFMQSYSRNKVRSEDKNYCLGCLHSTYIENDFLSQKLNIEKRLIWENEHFMVLTAYAPEHDAQIRIIPKQHRTSIWTLTEDEIHSMAKALSIANYVLSAFISQYGKKFFLSSDRNILFRQKHPETGIDIHLLVDIIPIQRVGGAERLDDYKISQIMPEEIARKMKEILSALDLY
ncbi:MAG: hypothetical protein ACTSPG_03905 [Candidatus Hodarchaeales archaeon]